MDLEQIELRLSQIKSEIETGDVSALEKEANELLEQRKAMLEEREQRKGLLEKVVGFNGPAVKVVEERKTGMDFEKETVLESKEYRSAWAKTLMNLPLNEVEKRALGTALTTTSSTYAAPTELADGVNNGGLFIPDSIMNDLMAKIELASPFFADVPKTSVSGYVKYPYKKSATGAGAQVEGVSNNDGSVEWAELTLSVLEVSETIRVTWKLESMSVDGFISFITDELAEAVPEKIYNEIFYGNGTNTLKGVTQGAVDGEYTIGAATGNVADVYEAITAAIALQTNKRNKKGAKLYVAQDIMEAMAFERDADGRFINAPINGVGISKFGDYQVVVDPYLAAGDFIFGNPRYYKFNWNEGLSVTKDVSGKQRINDYTGYAVVSGAPVPGAFVYGKKSS